MTGREAARMKSTPRSRHSPRRGAQQTPRCEPREQRHQPDHDDRQVPPQRPAMREGLHHAAGMLAEEDLARELLAARYRRGDRPQQRDRRAAQHGQSKPRIPASPDRPVVASHPQRREQRHGRQMQQDDRPLAEHAEADRQRDDDPAAPRAMAPRGDDADPADQRPERHDRVEHRQRGIEQEQTAGAHGERCELRRDEAVGKQPAREHRSGRQTSQREERRDETAPDLADPADRPAQLDQPEQQRRLVVIGLAIAVGNQEVAARPHLPRHREITRLIDRHQRSQGQADDDDHQPQQAGAQQRATQRGHVASSLISSSSASGRSARRCSHITPTRSTMPTQSRFMTPYFEIPAPRGR